MPARKALPEPPKDSNDPPPPLPNRPARPGLRQPPLPPPDSLVSSEVYSEPTLDEEYEEPGSPLTPQRPPPIVPSGAPTEVYDELTCVVTDEKDEPDDMPSAYYDEFDVQTQPVYEIDNTDTALEYEDMENQPPLPSRPPASSTQRTLPQPPDMNTIPQIKGMKSLKEKEQSPELAEKPTSAAISQPLDVSCISAEEHKELEETYKSCACQTRTGAFIRMKKIMADAIDKKRSWMFENTSQRLLQELDSLERDIIKVVTLECKSLCQDFMMASEPLWEVSSCRLIRNAILDSLTSVDTKVRQLYKDAQIEYTERASVPVSDANIPATTQLDTSKLNIPDEACSLNRAMKWSSTASNTQPGSVSEKSLNAGSLATSTVTSSISEPGLVQQEGVDSHNAPSSSFVGIKSEPGTRAASTIYCRGGVPHNETPGSTTEPASKKCKTEHISSSAPKYSACNWSAANIKQEPVEEKRIRSPLFVDFPASTDEDL